MKAINFETKKSEAEYLANWSIEIFKFFHSIQPYKNLSKWIDNLLQGVKESDIKGLRMAYNDMNEGVQDLLPDQYKKLDQILKEKFGHGLFEADKKHVKRVTKIVEKGKIKGEEQYYLLREYFERIWDMPEHKETAQKIEDMLFAFENRKQ